MRGWMQGSACVTCPKIIVCLLVQPNPKETTEKYGLEAGLWQVFRNKDPVTGKSKGQQAKDLLKRYGGAYLITSISFAVVSFAACYALVSAGDCLFSADILSPARRARGLMCS